MLIITLILFACRGKKLMLLTILKVSSSCHMHVYEKEIQTFPHISCTYNTKVCLSCNMNLVNCILMIIKQKIYELPK